MKKMFLLCNAHLDPVWLWTKNAGMAEAISTFRVAADFCEKYDGFVFNHNESFLYEIVEKEEPQLFERIKKLVAEKKWNIIGGWYVQADCNMPCGESLIEQINTGCSYFEEKFGVRPTTGFSPDAFGHSRGLVQILSKMGYKNYIFMRPYGKVNDFVWKGFDGSEICGFHMWDSYSTCKGDAAPRVRSIIDRSSKTTKDELILWGIGNHGGGPSEEDINALAELNREFDDHEIIHSTGEEYFAGLSKADMEIVASGLNYCMVGCYTTMSQIKRAHRRAENAFSVCKKLMACAEMTGEKDLADAKKQMLFNEFHDILPGTAIKQAEEEALRELGGAEAVFQKYINSAFLKLSGGQHKAKKGEIPVLVFNPYPYSIKADIEVEFLLENQNWTDGEFTVATAYDEKGNILKTQHETESSSLNLDWVKKIVFSADLEPMCMNRFNCRLEVVKDYVKMLPAEENDRCIIVRSDKAEVFINKSTGLIDAYVVDGKNRVQNNTGKLNVFYDNEDPWAMNVNSFNDFKGSFELLQESEADEFGGCRPVAVIEKGNAREKVQALYKYGNSYAIIVYTLSKNSAELDVDITILSNDRNVMVKYCVDTIMNNADFVGQTMFGCEKLPKDKTEVCFQKWCGLKNKDEDFYIFNKSNYGGSSDGTEICVSLLRTPCYSAHPIKDRQLVPTDRFMEHIDMGRREFSLKLSAQTENVDFTAQRFNETIPVLSFFPAGDGEKIDTLISLDNKDVILSNIERKDKEVKIRLYNSTDSSQDVNMQILNRSYSIKLDAYEIKQLTSEGEKLIEEKYII